MFIVDRNKELVGFSAWPWDSLYPPAVGCYRDGRLLAFAICDLAPQSVRLEGPPQRWWFRLRVDPDARVALSDGDPAVRLMRIEDGVEIPHAGPAESTSTAGSNNSVELFRSRTSMRSLRLDGFAAFLGAPTMHQLDILFLDILNRLPDPEARHHYGIMLETGTSVLTARKVLMESQEFIQRGITVSDRVGALITSPMWHELLRAEPLGERRVSLETVRMSDYADLSSSEFARQIHIDCHGDAPNEEATTRLAAAADTLGRSAVASLLVRDAANGGSFLNLIEA